MFTVLHIKDFEVSRLNLWHFRNYSCYLSYGLVHGHEYFFCFLPIKAADFLLNCLFLFYSDYKMSFRKQLKLKLY